mmetsp:Transcript_14409/g.21617  ORF Transcript_14409/g.21617 Transcript_14409/m.21617 type:complete len:1772 (-) Transcript_14409:314-5629(-)
MSDQSSLRVSTAECTSDSAVALVTEYRSLTPTITQRLLLKRSQENKECTAWSEKLFAAVVLADISGFTKLSSKLSVEQLKHHINHFFTYLLGKFKQHGGDVVKFCGDAVLVVWTAPINTDETARQNVVYKATKCVLEMLNDNCGRYEEMVGGHTIRLRLHCGMSAGELHCMSLGNENRMEFLIAGPQLRELSTAESAAKTGELCLSKSAYEYVKYSCTGQALPNGSFRITYVHKAHKILGTESPKSRNLSLVTTAMQFVQTLENLSPSRRSAKVFFDNEGDSSGCDGSVDSSTGVTPTSISTAFSFFKGGQTGSPSSSDKFVVSARDVIDNTHNTYTGSTKSTTSDYAISSSKFENTTGFHFLDNRCKKRSCDAVHKFDDRLSEEEDTFRTRGSQAETCSESGSSRLHSIEFRPSGPHLTKLSPSSADEYRKMLERYVHESARGAIVHNSSGHLAELRVVVTMFIQIMNLDDEFDKGEIEKPQKAIEEILVVLQKLGGALRQYVVDDKGCVVICSFGVPGFSSLSDDLRGVYASVLIRNKLQAHDIVCRIGVSKGMVYCGYVGSTSRKEYCMMGSSVNLAARLMGLCRNSQIIVSCDVYLGVNSDFIFDKLPKLNAKGYDSPVQVYSLQHLRKNPKAYVTVEEVAALLSTGRRGGCFVGRDEEMAILQKSFSLYINGVENSDTQEVCMLDECYTTSGSQKSILPSNKCVIVGGKGTGKTKVITEFLQRNEQVIQSQFLVSCHLANVLEPYEASRQLLKAFFDTKASPLGRAESTTDLEATLDSNCELVLDEDKRFELLYERIYAWVKNNLSDLTIDCVGVGMTEDTLQDFESAESFSSVATSRHSFVCRSVSGFLKSSDDAYDGVALEEKSTFGIMEVLPLLRIALDTKTRPDVELVTSVTSERIPALLEVIIVEIVCSFAANCTLGVLVLEELQWADKPSFRIINRVLDVCDSMFFVASMRPFIPIGRKPHHMRAESFEGSVVLNTVEELNSECKVINLKPISENEIKVVIENILGPVLLQCIPNAVSDAFVSNVYHKSGRGIVGMVIRQVKELEASVARSNFSASGENQVNVVDGTALEQFDRMNYDNQVVLKVAAVCGTIFTRNLLQQTLERMGYIDTARYLDQSLSEIEDRGLIQRVAGADYYKDGTFRLSTLRRRRTEMGSNKTYAFLDRRYSDSVYNIMLEKQREEAHMIVGTILAESLDMRSPTCNVVELLAFHYSRANDLEKEIMYTELAAASTKQENMHSSSYNYYHHLVSLATNGKTIDEITCACYPKSISRKYHRRTRRPKIHFDNLLASEKYLSPTDLKRKFHSVQPFISDIQLYCIIAEMSILKYKMCDFRESFNTALLSMHGLGLCTTMPRVMIKFYTRVLRTPGKTAFGLMLYYQAQSLMMRGKVDEALRFASTSACLVHKDDVNTTSSVMALLSTLYYVKRDTRKSSRTLSMCSTMTPRSKCALGSANLNFHLGIKQAATGNFKDARDHLDAALTGSVIRKDSSPLKYMVWNMSAWFCFFSGNLSEAEDTLRSVDRCHRENKAMSLWTSLFTVVVGVFRGELNQMRKILSNLSTTQKGHSGHIYTTCLKGLIGVSRKDYLCDVPHTRDHCIEAVIFSVTKLTKADQVTPIGIFSLFISVYCALKIIVEFDSVVGCRPGGGLLHRLRKHAREGVHAVTQLSHTFPVLSVLSTALHMKQAVADHKHDCHDGDVSVVRPELSNDNFAGFTFGLAFWHLERYNYCDYFHLCTNDLDRVSFNSYFKQLGMPADHPLICES